MADAGTENQIYDSFARWLWPALVEAPKSGGGCVAQPQPRLVVARATWV
jgi:hypothetical protein